MGKILKIPRSLIYKELTDIKAFRAGSSIINALYEQLLHVEGLTVHSERIQCALLELFNDIFYICTSVIVEQKPIQMLNYYWDIAGKREVHPLFFDGFNNVRANVVYAIISCVADSIIDRSRYLDELLDGMDKMADGNHLDMKESFLKTCVDRLVSYFAFPAEELFMPRKLTPELLDKSNLMEITCGFDEECIEELIAKLGKNLGYDTSDDRKFLILDAIERNAIKEQVDVPAVVARKRKELKLHKSEVYLSELEENNKKLIDEVKKWQEKCNHLEAENGSLKRTIGFHEHQIESLKAKPPKIEGITAEEIEQGFRSIETPESRRMARTYFKEVLDGHIILRKALENLKKDKVFDDILAPTTNILVNRDYVMTKNVENEVEHVDEGGIGISVNKDNE